MNRLRFGVIADPQYADKDPDFNYHRDFRGALQKFHDAIDHFNAEPLDFVIVLGDYVDDHKKDFPLIFRELENSRHEIIHVLGNHDYKAIDDGQNLDEDDQKSALVDLFGLENNYYSRVKNNFRLIILDTSGGFASLGDRHEIEDKSRENLGDFNYELSADHVWNGYVDKEQQAWLASELTKAEEDNEKAIIFSHDPIFPLMRDGLKNSEEVLEIIHNYRDVVALNLSGHFHQGTHGMFANIPFFTMKAMVVSGDTAYSICEVNGSDIKIQGFGRENSYIVKDSF
jgi:3',5'-cyclic AMP phosphodiesterase CpdA